MQRSFAWMALLAALSVSPAHAADASSPAGRWKTISDLTGKPASIVEITVADGVYSGRVVELLNKSADAVCTKCTDAHHNERIVGLVFLTGLRKEGESYAGGEILNPEDGKVYRARMTLQDGGKRLEVRGFIGFSLFGKSQNWYREE